MKKKSRARLLKAGLFTSVLSVFLQTSSAYASEISTVSQLLAITGEQNYVLVSNLDLATGDADSATDGIQLADVVTVGSSTYITNGFTGTLDGAGFSISGLTKPLFNAIGGDGIHAEVSNVTLIADEDGVSGRGMLANSTNIGTEIENVHAIGDVNGGVSANVGGLVGSQSTGEIRESSFTGDVTGTNVVGGLVGEASGNISNSTFSGEVTGERYVGGIAGATGGQIISNSSASGSVTGLANGEGNIGGLVGGGSGTITNSHTDVTVTGEINYSRNPADVPLDDGPAGIDSNGYVLNRYGTRIILNGPENIGGLLGYGDVSATISNSYSTGSVAGQTKVGGLVGTIAGSSIKESYSTSTVQGVATVGGLVGYADKGIYSGIVRGVLAAANDTSYCEIPSFSCLSSQIQSSYSTGNVTASGGAAGGLVGRLYSGAILNSYSTSNVVGGTTVGGLVGRVYSYGQNSYLTFEGNPFENYYGLVENSYATGTINIGYNSANRIGGLVGILNGGKLVNSYATAGGLDIDASGGCDHVGGLVGDGSGFEGVGSAGIIQDSFAYIEGNISAGCGQVGGLAGSMGAGSTITNSFAYVSGAVIGGDYAGGLIGYFLGDLDDVHDSYALVSNLQVNEESTRKGTFTVLVVWTGDSLITTPIDFTEEQEIELPALPSILSVVNTDYETGPFALSSCFHSGLPYLTALAHSYTSSCSTTNNNRLRNRNVLSPTKVLEKALDQIGFKDNALLNSNGAIKFPKDGKDIKASNINFFEIFDYTYTSIFLNKGDGLQLSISSYYKESAEIWTKGLDGNYLYVGLAEFDKYGQAILPTLIFDTVNSYQLLIIKAEDKLSEKPNLERKIGEITINVI